MCRKCKSWNQEVCDLSRSDMILLESVRGLTLIDPRDGFAEAELKQTLGVFRALKLKLLGHCVLLLLFTMGSGKD